jgi:hypothetical protein
MASVELRLFIKQALLDIVGGVADAQKEAPEGSVAPEDISQTFKSVEHGVSHLQPISFELKVVADRSTGTGAKIGVIGAAMGLSAHGESKDSNQVHSTLKFTVPVHLPAGGCSWADREEKARRRQASTAS